MAAVSRMKEPYEAAMRGEWNAMVDWYKEQGAWLLLFPLSFADDTAFHFAVYSRRDNPLTGLLDLSNDNPMTSDLYMRRNAFGNTALHEAGTCGNYEAAKLLVEKNSNQLNLQNERGETLITHIRNERGETPLFRAAAYGRNKVVNYLASLPGEMPDQKLNIIHRYSTTVNSDTADASTFQASILHEAIRGEHFGTALLLLKLDKSLLDRFKDKTALELLATMPSAFKSGYHMSIWRALLYRCTYRSYL